MKGEDWRGGGVKEKSCGGGEAAIAKASEGEKEGNVRSVERLELRLEGGAGKCRVSEEESVSAVAVELLPVCNCASNNGMREGSAALRSGSCAYKIFCSDSKPPSKICTFLASSFWDCSCSSCRFF